MVVPSVPLLHCDEAKVWEEGVFAGDDRAETRALRAAGTALGRALGRDFLEAGPWPPQPLILILVGKGHNGADAVVAAGVLADQLPTARFAFYFVLGTRGLRPSLEREWRDVSSRLRERGSVVTSLAGRYDLVLDGVFGFNYRPPLPCEATRCFQAVNAAEVRFRAAVDLPSGLGEPDGFFADFTYGTGILKKPVVAAEHAAQVGRIRFLDIGLFGRDEGGLDGPRVVLPSVLDPLRRLRPAQCDKRDFGHLLVLGGSRVFPGAVLMTVRAALLAGTGLVTAFVPEDLVPAYAAAVPEAMWVGWPVTPEGGLALEGLLLARRHGQKGTAWVMGPGLGREPETQVLVQELLREETRPVVLDADALQPAILAAARGPLILTPHAGEWERIAGGRTPSELARALGAIVVAKGSPTWVFDGVSDYLLPVGGPVLARGGSGDILAGLVGGRVAQAKGRYGAVVCGAAYWQGAAADAWARARGATATRTTEILDFLPLVLREEYQ